MLRHIGNPPEAQQCHVICARLQGFSTQPLSSFDVRRVAEEHVDEIDGKIAELKAMRKTLSTLVHACHGDHRPDCPILEDLAGR